VSACLIIQYKDKIYVGSDTALITRIEDSFFRIKQECHKLYKYNDRLIFCSGDMKYVNQVINFLDKNENINPEKISNFLKLNVKKNESKIFNIEVVIFVTSHGCQKIFQISEYNNFEVIEHSLASEGIKVLACGIKTRECLDISQEEIRKQSDIKSIFKNTFNRLSCNQIGGNLDLWEIRNDIKKIFSCRIDEQGINFLPKNLCVHSIVADIIVGNLIAGNELRISNDANTFTLDGGGATLTNAIFKLTTTNGNSQILLDPQDGIRIRGLDSRIGSPTSGSIINKLWMDSNGNLNIIGNANIEGSIIADLGYIGGWRIAQDGLYDNFGNWIKSTGNIRLGVLSINGSTGIFNGNFYANNLMGLVRGGADGWPQQMGNIDASLITAGTMLADRIYGGVIRWPHGELGESGTGYPYMHGEHQLVINQGGNYLHPEWGYNEIGMSGNGMNLSSSYIVIGSSDQNGVINLRSNLYTNGMDTKNVDAFPNFRKMMFRNGLLVGYNDGDPIEGTTTPFSVSVSFAYGLGVVAYIEVPFNCHINRATIVANAVGSMEIDIYKTPLWNHPGTVANSIIPAYAYLTSSIWANCSTSTWNTALTASDILTISVHSMSSLISLATFTISGWRD
jgi:hypothetical protein